MEYSDTVCHQDLKPLLPNKQMKIPSLLINMFRAYLQRVLDDAPDGIDDIRKTASIRLA